MIRLLGEVDNSHPAFASKRRDELFISCGQRRIHERCAGRSLGHDLVDTFAEQSGSADGCGGIGVAIGGVHRL